MKIEIDVDLGPLADEWEIVAIRRGREGEHVVHNGNVVQLPGVGYVCQLVVRKKWQWPEWLKAKWIAGDQDGAWYAYDLEPCIRDDARVVDGYWYSENSPSTLLTPLRFAFTPPPCDDWRQSKRRNPHIKENQCQK